MSVKYVGAAPSPARTRLAAKEFLSRKEAALYLGEIGCPISPRTLANMASNNNKMNGPPYLRFRWKLIRYRRVDLEEWASREMVRVG